jgi:putative aldouronate transport system substrate-binding protein
MQPAESNSAWQAMNKAVNANLKLNVSITADYPPRLAALLAGGDLPDVLNNIHLVPSAPDLLSAKFVDLTPYLSGDAIKDYPNLANIPTRSWSQTIFNNRIYGVPVPSPAFTSAMDYHQELLDQAGIPVPANAAELKKALLALSKPEAGVWGISALVAYGLETANGSFLTGMFGAPMQWSLGSGVKLTKDIETDGFKAALTYVRDLTVAGAFHPLTSTLTATQADSDWRGGKFVFFNVPFIAPYLQDWTLMSRLPNVKMDLLPPLGSDTGRAVAHLNPANFGISFIKQASVERVKELLGVLNFLAAPFGSEEHLLINYGLEGQQFNFDKDGNPVLTDQGRTQVYPAVPWGYVAAAAPALYNPNKPQDFVNVFHTLEEKMLAVAVSDPTVGFYSATDSRQGAALLQTFWDGITDVCAGRRPLSDLDALVKAWRDGGGDKIREEYQAAISAGA